PHPEMRSVVTRASASATPPTTLRPRIVMVSVPGAWLILGNPAAGAGGVDALRRGAEPGLHPEDGREVVGLLGRVAGHDLRAGRHGTAHGRAAVGEDPAAGGFDDRRVAVPVGQVLDRAGRP